MNSSHIFVTTDLFVDLFIASHRNPFPALSSGIPVNIIRFISFLIKFFHCLLHSRGNPWFTAGYFNNSHLTDNTAVTGFSVILDIFRVMDHIAGDFQFMTKCCKDTAEIGVIVAVDDHTVTVFFLHIFYEFPCKTYFVSAKCKWKKILSFHKKCIFVICIGNCVVFSCL